MILNILIKIAAADTEEKIKDVNNQINETNWTVDEWNAISNLIVKTALKRRRILRENEIKPINR